MRSAKCEVEWEVDSDKWWLDRADRRRVRRLLASGNFGGLSHHSSLSLPNFTWHFALRTWHCKDSVEMLELGESNRSRSQESSP